MMKNYSPSRFRRTFRSGTGTAAVEFAIIFPVLLMMCLAVIEVRNMITTNSQLQTVANSIGQMIAVNTSGYTNATDIQFATDSTMVLFPYVLTDSYNKGESWDQDIKITISNIVFKSRVAGCQSNCTFDAYVAWSRGDSKRPCGTVLTAVADSSSPTTTTLPTDSYPSVNSASGSLIVVDVSFIYNTNIWKELSGPYTYKKSVYLQPRYIDPTSYIKYDTTDDDGKTQKCSGY